MMWATQKRVRSNLRKCIQTNIAIVKIEPTVLCPTSNRLL